MDGGIDVARRPAPESGAEYVAGEAGWAGTHGGSRMAADEPREPCHPSTGPAARGHPKLLPLDAPGPGKSLTTVTNPPGQLAQSVDVTNTPPPTRTSTYTRPHHDHARD